MRRRSGSCVCSLPTGVDTSSTSNVNICKQRASFYRCRYQSSTEICWRLLAFALAVPFIAVALLSLLTGVFMVKALPAGVATQRRYSVETPAPSPSGRWRTFPFVLIGLLGGLAFASENAHQSWSAVFAHNELHAGVGLSAVAPAVFAGVVGPIRPCGWPRRPFPLPQPPGFRAPALFAGSVGPIAP
jgi:hypothetical protein